MKPDHVDRLVERVLETCGSPIAVVGDSEAADRARAAFGSSGAMQAEDPPATIVEMTGTASGLAAAFASVADLGTVVLAGPAPSAPVALDLHDDLHVRGLTLLGVDLAAT